MTHKRIAEVFSGNDSKILPKLLGWAKAQPVDLDKISFDIDESTDDYGCATYQIELSYLRQETPEETQARKDAEKARHDAFQAKVQNDERVMLRMLMSKYPEEWNPEARKDQS